MESTTVGFIGIICLLIFMLLGFPIWLCLALVGTGGIAYLMGWHQLLYYIVPYPVGFTTGYVMCAFPLFTMMGFVALEGGYAEDLFTFAFRTIGRLPGGLASACTMASGMFGAISSSGGIVPLSAIAFPQMKRYKYDEGVAAAQIAAGNPIGALIPPSTSAILYAVVCKVSAGKQLIAGFIPGLILMTLLVIMMTVRALINPGIGQRAVGITRRETLLSLRSIWFVLIIFAMILYSIYGGIATPTEAAAVGLFAFIIIALAMGRLKWGGFTSALSKTVYMFAMAWAILLGAALFSSFITLSGLPKAFADWVVGSGMSSYAALAVIMALYVPLGMFIDTLSLIVIVVPVILPLVYAFGWDVTWFGILIRTMIGVATLSPPLAIGVYYVAAITKLPVHKIFRQVPLPILCYLIAVAIFIAFPEVVLFLPNMMKM